MSKKMKKMLLTVFLVGVIIGQAVWNIEQSRTIRELEGQVSDLQGQLSVSRDILNQINARNEAIKYIGGLME